MKGSCPHGRRIVAYARPGKVLACEVLVNSRPWRHPLTSFQGGGVSGMWDGTDGKPKGGWSGGAGGTKGGQSCGSVS